MLDTLLSFFAPHHCYGCGKLGTLLCSNCKYNIISEQQTVCIVCGRQATRNGICSNEVVPFSRAWLSGERTDVLKHLIDDFKFENVYAVHSSLASLLSETLGLLPGDVTVTAVPTAPAHIRQRGYDHAALLARSLARRQHLPYKSLLRRTTTRTQRGASRKERFKQAEKAFTCPAVLKGGRYLLVDDIVTTTATLQAASRALRAAGADEVWVAAVARQPLDE